MATPHAERIYLLEFRIDGLLFRLRGRPMTLAENIVEMMYLVSTGELSRRIARWRAYERRRRAREQARAARRLRRRRFRGARAPMTVRALSPPPAVRPRWAAMLSSSESE